MTAPEGREAAVCANPTCLRCHCTHPPRQRGRKFAAVCKEHGCDRYQPAPVAPAPSGERETDTIERVSAKVHENWMAAKRAAGVESRKLESGEELMVPYVHLSNEAKELDRGTVRTVLAVLPDLGYRLTPDSAALATERATLDRLREAVEGVCGSISSMLERRHYEDDADVRALRDELDAALDTARAAIRTELAEDTTETP